MTVEFSGEYTITRASKGVHVKGKYVKGPGVEISIELNWQTLSGEELLSLPELQRTKRSLKIYSEEEIIGLDKTKKIQADIVTIDCVDYEIQNVKQYKNTGLCDHYKAIAVEINK